MGQALGLYLQLVAGLLGRASNAPSCAGEGKRFAPRGLRLRALEGAEPVAFVKMAPLDAITETMRLAREEVERDIARYRVLTFAALMSIVACVFVIIWISKGSQAASLGPTIYFGIGTLYALGAQRWLTRRRSTRGYVYVTVLADLVLSVFVYLIVARVAQVTTVESWISHVLAPGLILFLLLHSLRSEPRVNVLATAVAVALYAVSARLGAGSWELPQLISGGVICVVGFITMLWNRQSLRRLEIHARVGLLSRFVSAAAVERVLETDGALVLQTGGRLVTVTLLTADLRGFTAMSEQVPPEQVVEELNAYHGRMQTVIDRHQGLLDKFMGDGTLVVFGYPEAADQGAEAAIACARDMLTALAELNHERVSHGRPALAMGIGVHTGQAVAGAIGSPGTRLEFTFIGDAVNTASRIESLTKELAAPLLISYETVKRVGPRGDLVEHGPVVIRGRQEPLCLFSLQGA
jgi:class 3 adenylate cyclase